MAPPVLQPNESSHTISASFGSISYISIARARTYARSGVRGCWQSEACPRVRLVKSKDGIKNTANIMELARELGRDRSDMYEIVVWEDGVKVVGNTLYYYQAVHQESDVIPENIDCIRSMCKMEQDAATSQAKTNKAMGISQ